MIPKILPKLKKLRLLILLLHLPISKSLVILQAEKIWLMLIEFIQSLSLILQIIYSLLLLALLVQLLYYFLIFLRPVFWKRKIANTKQEPLSVIICAKNEHDNLQENLPKILDQNYPDFEVIVVNDCSTDDSEMLLGTLQQKYPRLRHTTIEPDKKFTHGKKLAITIGMKSAKNNRLVFTDADCYPGSNDWLMEISKSYVINKQIVLAFSGYERKRGLLNKIIQYDTLMVAVQYLGFAMVGRPYMGVGRNLSYLKQLFFAGKGFASHYHILSGDDDLFINENADKQNTAVVLSKSSFTISKPETTWKGWFKQKKRHLSTGKYYRFGDKFFLGLEIASRFLFYAAILTLLLVKHYSWVLLGIYGCRLLVQMLVLKLNMSRLNQKGFWFLIPILDIILPIIHLFFIISNKKNTSKSKWK